MDIGKIVFGPALDDPLRVTDEERRFLREPGFSIEHPPVRVPQPWTPKRCKIREGYMDAGRIGTALAEVHAAQAWTVVLWDDEDEPDLFKSKGLEPL